MNSITFMSKILHLFGHVTCENPHSLCWHCGIFKASAWSCIPPLSKGLKKILLEVGVAVLVTIRLLIVAKALAAPGAAFTTKELLAVACWTALTFLSFSSSSDLALKKHTCFRLTISSFKGAIHIQGKAHRTPEYIEALTPTDSYDHQDHYLRTY